MEEKLRKTKKVVFRKKQTVFVEICKLFFDSSGRSKKTPRHESAIQVRLETKFSPTEIRTGLGKLVKKQILSYRKIAIKDVGDAKFYFLSEFDKENNKEVIDKKITNLASWIKRYSQEKIRKMIGNHLHDLVKAELRAQNFQILNEKDVKEFEGKKWTKTPHSLDITAQHKQKKYLKIGLEVKNTSYPTTSKREISIKIDMCRYFGIKPVFATRWLEMHREFITKSGGFLWQFEKQLYPRGQEGFVRSIQSKFRLPVIVDANLPDKAIKEIETWIEDA